jgi:hypothetical protein
MVVIVASKLGAELFNHRAYAASVLDERGEYAIPVITRHTAIITKAGQGGSQVRWTNRLNPADIPNNDATITSHNRVRARGSSTACGAN